MKTINLFLFALLFLGSGSAYAQSNQNIYNRLLSVKERIFEDDQKSQKSLDSLKPVLEKAEVDSLWGLYYRTISTLLSNQMEKDKALENLNLSISYYQKAKNPKGVALSMMNKGNIFLFQGKTKETLSTYLKALEITNKNNLHYESGLLYKNIGVLYLNNEKFDEALNYSTKSYNIFKNLNKDEDMGRALVNIGNSYYMKYDFDKALLYYNEAMVISEKLKDSSNIAKLLNNIGAIYIDDKRDLKKGMGFLLKSLEIKKKLKDQNSLLLQYNSIATYYAGAGDFAAAEAYLRQALELAKKSNNKDELKEVYETYSNIYEEKGDFGKALNYYKLYSGIKDSILNKENIEILEDLKIKYKTAEKDAEITTQKSKLFKRNVLVFALIGLLLLAFVYYKNYQNNQKVKLQKEILYQQDLATKAVMKAEDDERKRMALHLHDGIGTLLSAINMNINVLEDFKHNENQFSNVLTKTKSILDDAITDVRDLSHQIMPNMLIKNSLSNALRDLIEKTNSPKLKIILNIDGLKDDIDQNIQVVIYRIIQECINNIIKHADAQSVKISIFQDDKSINIKIIDDGKGFDPLAQTAKSEGMGLENIKSRIEFLKGKIQIESVSDQGTGVQVEIPLV